MKKIIVAALLATTAMTGAALATPSYNADELARPYLDPAWTDGVRAGDWNGRYARYLDSIGATPESCAWCYEKLDAINAAEAALRGAPQTIVDLRHTIDGLQSSLAHLSATHEEEVELLNDQLNQLRAIRNADSTQIAQLTSQLQTARNSLTLVDGELDRAGEEITRLTAEVTKWNEHVVALNRHTYDLNAEIRDLQAIVDAETVYESAIIEEAYATKGGVRSIDTVFVAETNTAAVAFADGTYVGVQATADEVRRYNGFSHPSDILRFVAARNSAVSYEPATHGQVRVNKYKSKIDRLNSALAGNHTPTVDVPEVNYNWRDGQRVLNETGSVSNARTYSSNGYWTQNLYGVNVRTHGTAQIRNGQIHTNAGVMVNGGTQQLTISDVNQIVEGAYGHGFIDGYGEGYEDGYTDGYTDGYGEGWDDALDYVNTGN